MKAQSEFRQARQRLLDIEKANARASRDLGRQCDWDDPSDVALYRRGRNLERRLETLQRLVPTRQCPRCEKLVLNTRSWVIARNRSSAICRTCFGKLFVQPVVKRGSMLQKVDATLFRDVVKKYRIDPIALVAARNRTGYSQREFARRCGWAASYQRKLEASGDEQIDFVSEDNARVILQVLAEQNVVTKDVME